MDHRAPQGDATDTVQRFVGILAQMKRSLSSFFMGSKVFANN